MMSAEILPFTDNVWSFFFSPHTHLFIAIVTISIHMPGKRRFEIGREFPAVRKRIWPCHSNSKSKLYLRWLVEGSSTYYLYASVAFFLAALISSLI